MTLLFVVSPYAITHQVLPLIKEKNFKNLTVVTTEGLAPFFKELQIKTIVPNVNQNLFDRNSKHKILINAIKANKEYEKLFSRVKNDDVYLFFSTWAVVYFSYAKKLSKNNKIYLYETSQNKDIQHKKVKGLKSFIMKVVAKLILNIDTDICYLARTNAYVLKKNCFPIESVLYDKFESDLSNVFKDNPKLKGKKVLFLSSEIETEGADIKEIEKLTDYLYSIFEKKYIDSYVIKGHPQNGVIYGKMKKSKHIISNKTIAETLLGHKWKFIISYYSEFLVSAKIRTNAKIVSLLYLWEWVDLDAKEHWIKAFDEVGVLMPKNLLELKSILEEENEN